MRFFNGLVRVSASFLPLFVVHAAPIEDGVSGRPRAGCGALLAKHAQVLGGLPASFSADDSLIGQYRFRFARDAASGVIPGGRVVSCQAIGRSLK